VRVSSLRWVLVSLLLSSCARDEHRSEAPPGAVTIVPPAPKTDTVAASTYAEKSVEIPVRTSSTIALGNLGRRVAFVADEDDGVLRVVDLQTGKEISRLTLAGRPSSLVLDGMGRVYVSIRDRNLVQVLLACDGGTCGAPFEEIARLPTAEEPVALALTPKEETLLVTSGWGRALEAFSTESRKKLFAVPLSREPRGVVVSRDGKRAFVAHAVGSTVSVVGLDKQAVTETIGLGGEDTGFSFGPTGKAKTHPRFVGQGFAATRLGDEILVPVTVSYPGGAEAVTTGYGGDALLAPVEPAIVSIDRGEPAWLRTMGVTAKASEPRRREIAACKRSVDPCLLPRAIVPVPSRSTVLIACAGIDQVVEHHRGSNPLNASERARWLVASGPTGIAFDEASSEAVVWSQLDRVITILPVSDGKTQATGSGTTTIRLDPIVKMPTDVAEGRREFLRPIGTDKRSCASCHPDGRDDGLAWSSPLGKRQTPMLAGRIAGAAPYGWGGEAKTVELHLDETFKRLGAPAPSAKTSAALIAWVGAMYAPDRAKTKLGKEARRGREVFLSPEVGCSSCHIDEGRATDGVLRNIGSGGNFDTPSLRFVGGTAPYFHDGRYATLRDLLVATDGKMGFTQHLNATDFDALIAYLESI